MNRSWLRENRHVLLLSMFLVRCACYFLIQYLPLEAHIVHIPADDLIPFLPPFILFYVAWYLYVPLPMIYTAFRDKSCFYRQCAILFPGMILAVIFFILYPTTIDFRPTAEGPGFFRWVCRLIYQNDKPMNEFPSLHVYEAVSLYFATFHGNTKYSKMRCLRFFAAIMMGMICLSTVFVKQHSLADVFGGIALFILVYTGYTLITKHRERKIADCKKPS